MNFTNLSIDLCLCNFNVIPFLIIYIILNYKVCIFIYTTGYLDKTIVTAVVKYCRNSVSHLVIIMTRRCKADDTLPSLCTS